MTPGKAGGHLILVEVRAIFAVYLDVDEHLVQHGGGMRILE